MSAAVGSYLRNDTSSLDRMLYRGAAATGYARDAAASSESAKGTVTERGDSVALSENTPRQIEQAVLRDAIRTAEKISGGQKLSTDEMERMREDPAFSAMTAMFAMQNATRASLADYLGSSSAGTLLGATSGGTSLEALASRVAGQWPADVDTPSASDLAGMTRRLSQRLSGTEGVVDGSRLQTQRRDLAEMFRSGDYAQLAALLGANTE